MTLRQAAVKILTEPPAIFKLSTIRGELPVQAVEVEVSEADGIVDRLVIVHAYYPQMSISECEEIVQKLRLYFQGAKFSVAVTDSEGEAEVYIPVTQEQTDAFLVASTVAVIKMSWGWEEANPMRIMVAGKLVQVRLDVANDSFLVSEVNAIYR